MSLDIVDDLHHAEDTIGTAAAVLTRLLAVAPAPRMGSSEYATVIEEARRALADLDGYCRPGCDSIRGDRDTCDDEDQEGCGCPCHDR